MPGENDLLSAYNTRHNSSITFINNVKLDDCLDEHTHTRILSCCNFVLNRSQERC